MFPNEINLSEPEMFRLFLERAFSGAESLVKRDVLFASASYTVFLNASMTAV